MKGWSRGHSEMPKLECLLPKFKVNTSGRGAPLHKPFPPAQETVAWLACRDAADSISTDTTPALSSSLEESPLVTTTGERAL